MGRLQHIRLARSTVRARPRRTSRWLHVVVALAALSTIGLSARDASAQWAVGVQAGRDLVEDQFSIGAHALVPFYNIGPITQIAAYPNIDAFVFEDATIVRFDIDLAFPFRLQKVPLVPYAGLGFGIVYENEDFREDTHFDLNLLGGLAVQTGTIVEPYFETVASLFGSDTVGLYLGINIFPMGVPGRSETVVEENPANLDQDDDL